VSEGRIADQERFMSDTNTEDFEGYSETSYQHTMHTYAWISLWLIIGIGVAFGIFGFIHGLSN
jgi:hypothetical protein